MQLFRRGDTSYYDFQRLVGRALLFWGGANVAAGAAAQFSGSTFLKQFGVQALAWGAIDALLGWFGLRGNAKNRASGADITRLARRFRMIVALNALLDLGYIAGGMVALRRGRGQPARAGMGLGIIVQGLFLLMFDLALTVLSGRWTRER